MFARAPTHTHQLRVSGARYSLSHEPTGQSGNPPRNLLGARPLAPRPDAIAWPAARPRCYADEPKAGLYRELSEKYGLALKPREDAAQPIQRLGGEFVPYERSSTSRLGDDAINVTRVVPAVTQREEICKRVICRPRLASPTIEDSVLTRSYAVNVRSTIEQSKPVSVHSQGLEATQSIAANLTLKKEENDNIVESPLKRFELSDRFSANIKSEKLSVSPFSAKNVIFGSQRFVSYKPNIHRKRVSRVDFELSSTPAKPNASPIPSLANRDVSVDSSSERASIADSDSPLVELCVDGVGRYRGESAEGQMTGLGRLTDWKDETVYEGWLAANAFEGVGTLFPPFEAFPAISTPWNDLNCIEKCIKAFRGGFKANLFDGMGIVEYSDESKFFGEFKEGKANGFGVWRGIENVVFGFWSANLLVELL